MSGRSHACGLPGRPAVYPRVSLESRRLFFPGYSRQSSCVFIPLSSTFKTVFIERRLRCAISGLFAFILIYAVVALDIETPKPSSYNKNLKINNLSRLTVENVKDFHQLHIINGTASESYSADAVKNILAYNTPTPNFVSSKVRHLKNRSTALLHIVKKLTMPLYNSSQRENKRYLKTKTKQQREALSNVIRRTLYRHHRNRYDSHFDHYNTSHGNSIRHLVQKRRKLRDTVSDHFHDYFSSSQNDFVQLNNLNSITVKARRRKSLLSPILHSFNSLNVRSLPPSSKRTRSGYYLASSSLPPQHFLRHRNWNKSTGDKLPARLRIHNRRHSGRRHLEDNNDSADYRKPFSNLNISANRFINGTKVDEPHWSHHQQHSICDHFNLTKVLDHKHESGDIYETIKDADTSDFDEVPSTRCTVKLSTNTVKEYCAVVTENMTSQNCHGASRELLDVVKLPYCDHIEVSELVENGWCDTYEGCLVSMRRLMELDTSAQQMSNMFTEVVGQLDCEDRYSPSGNCADCLIWYKMWLCNVTLPMKQRNVLEASSTHGVERFPSDQSLPSQHDRRPEEMTLDYDNASRRVVWSGHNCDKYEEEVVRNCPFFRPHSDYQHSGEPAFALSCRG